MHIQSIWKSKAILRIDRLTKVARDRQAPRWPKLDLNISCNIDDHGLDLPLKMGIENVSAHQDGKGIASPGAHAAQHEQCQTDVTLPAGWCIKLSARW